MREPMLRRTVLALSVAGWAKRLSWKLSIRVEPVFPGLSLDAQLERVAAAGYPGFEFGDWRAVEAGAITKRMHRLKLE